ncbi:MAG: tetratricopeptide repeat protein [Candidatus Sumerlaeota bacterium]|nr:tetratricopeptide repeat protein [Candidatus Sumerlaeota bacterium]
MPRLRLNQLQGFWPSVVFLATLATHLFYISEVINHPFFNYPLVDSETYHKQALGILRDGWLSGGAFWQAPLYPYFLAVCYHWGARFFDIRAIQAVIAALSALLLYELGRRMVGRGAGAIAGLAAALYGPMIFFDEEILAPSLIIAIYLALALALDRAIHGGKFLWWPAAGLLVGLAALAHGLGLLIAPLICLYALLKRDFGPDSLKRRLRIVAAFGAGVAAVVAPVAIRNRVAGGEWVLISYNGPINFYIGNHPDYDKMVGLRPGLEWASLARSLNEKEIWTIQGSSRHFIRETLANMARRPLAVGRVWLKKIFLFFNADEIKRNYPIYPVRGYSHLLWALMWKWSGPAGAVGIGFPFGIVLPLAALGWWALYRRGMRLVAVELILAGHFAANLLFFVCARYRVPVAPFLLLYAAAGAQWIIGERIWRLASLKAYWRPLAVAAAIFLVSNARLGAMDNAEDRAEYQFYLGYVSQQKRQPQQALDHYIKALRDNPDNMETHFYLGLIYQDSLRLPEKALEQFDWVLARDAGNMPVMYQRARALAALGKTGEARSVLEELVKNNPGETKYRDFLNRLEGKT